jgi:hypothetical protein
VGVHRPDYHSLESVLNFSQFKGKSDEALVLALYDFFTSTIDGTYHFWPSDELQGQPRIRRYVSDPIKLFNCYGWHICGQSSVIQYALYHAAGLKARQFSIPAHVLCEVFYDDAWHVFDVDMWTWFRNKQGKIASAFELIKDAQSLIVENDNKSNPCNLPDRTLEDYAKTYSSAQTKDDHVKDIFPHWFVNAHQMDFHLRPGESVTISENPQGAFIFPDAWRESLANNGKEWQGHPRERFEPFRSYGNGEWRYQPRLSSDYGDLAHAVWSQTGTQQIADGIKGAGKVAFRIQSPYIFAAKPHVEEKGVRYSAGAQLQICGFGHISVILLLEEQTVRVAEFDGEIDELVDLTTYMTARYEVVIQFELGADALLQSFSFHAPIMTAPMSLPRLMCGQNKLELCTADKYQRKTIPWKHIFDFTPTANPLALCLRADNAIEESWAQGWKCLAPKDVNAPIDVVCVVEAPGDRTFSWFHALCSVKEAKEGQQNQSARFSRSTDGENWQLIKQSTLSATHLQWDMSLEGDVLLRSSEERVYLRIQSDSAITGLEFYGHLDASDLPNELIVIEHAWQEGQKVCKKRFVGVNEYTLECESAPSHHSITFSVDSV